MRQITSSMRRRHGGFSLVEIMVGLAIGMLAVTVILQVLALSEQRKRTTTGAGDALTNGVMLFYNLKREVSMAGFGFGAKEAFDCPLKWSVGGTNIATAIRLAPVTINPSASVIPAGDANTDRLLIVYGNYNGQPQGSPINQGAASTVLTGSVRGAFAVGDRVIAIAPGCGTDQLLTTVTAATEASVTVAASVSGSVLYNLGPAPVIQAYAIRGGRLTVCNYLETDCGLAASKDDPSVWVPIANNIVSLRAQYGRDAASPADGIVSVYDQTTPTAGASGAGCNWARMPAMRLALVARSSQYDPGEVTAAAPVWAGSTDAPIDLTSHAQWKHYRYKIFEGVVPIRNVTWMGGAEC